jgi:hypothetical protein
MAVLCKLPAQPLRSLPCPISGVSSGFAGFNGKPSRLCAALAALTAPGRPLGPVANFVARALIMLQSIGWITAHRVLFSDLRFHLLGWPPFLAPAGHRVNLRPGAAPS